MSDVFLNVPLLDQHVVDLNAVAAAAVVVYDLLLAIPKEWMRESSSVTGFWLARLLLRGLAAAVLILNASQLGFARTQQFCHGAALFFPIAIEVLVVLAFVLFATHAVSYCSFETRTGHFVLSGFASVLVIAQLATFIMALVLHPPRASVTDGWTGCIYHTTPYDKFSCFWWPALALQMMFVVNAGLQFGGACKGGRVSAVGLSCIVQHSVLAVLLLLLSVFGVAGKPAAARSTVWWFVAGLSISTSHLKLNEIPMSAHPSSRVESQPPTPVRPSPVSRREANRTEPSSSFMEGFVTVPLPAQLRNLFPVTDQTPQHSRVPSTASLQSIPSIATTSVEFAARTNMSPRNSRVDANFDVGREYIPYSRRTPLPPEWRSPV